MHPEDMWIAVEVLKMLIQDQKVTFSDLKDSILKRGDRLGEQLGAYSFVVRTVITEANREN
jgi:hypothetical protein